MRRLAYIWLLWGVLLPFVVPVCSQEIAELDPDPEWYVAPENIDAYIRAPKRTNADACPKDSTMIYDIDSVLVEVTVYEYGDTTRTTVWKVNADGTRTGKSKTEEASTATGAFDATYAWDATANNWMGTSKTEHVYANNKETTRILYKTWLNNAWVADTKYTWTYDAAGREHEYTTYNRNQTTNELVLSQQRIRVWYNNTKLTSEIQYTAHNGTDWSAGTKKEYNYDTKGNQIEYTYYSSLFEGNWIGSTHEKWTYNASRQKTYYEKQTWSNGWANSTKEIWEFNGPLGKQTLHEKYNGSGSSWTLALEENLGYDAAGNNSLVENYSLTSNVWKGTKKEEYTFVGTAKTGTITYNWDAGTNAFVYKSWSVNNTAENPNEKCSYNRVGDAWVGTGTRTLTTKTGGKVTEVVTQNWPTGSTVWVNKNCTTTVWVGNNKTQETYSNWSEDGWVGTKRTDYHWNASNKNDTITTYAYSADGWIYSDRTVNTFNAGGATIMIHNAKWQNNAWVMTSMKRTDIIDITEDGIRQTLNAQWQCGADSVWKGTLKDTSAYYFTAKNTQKTLYTAHFTSWASNDWVPSYKVNYAYDEKDRTILNERYNWVNNKWQGYYRYEDVYNEDNQPTLSIFYDSWNASTDRWIGSSKLETTYDESGNTTAMLSYSWQNGDWQPTDNTLFSYDANNNPIEQISQKCTDGVWTNVSRLEKAYRGSELIKSNEYKWKNDDWQFSRRSEKTYDEDAQAKLRREIEGRWNDNGVVTSFTDKLHSYACDPRYHTIRFVNYDGTELSSEKIEEGQTPKYSGEDPVRKADAEFTYSFTGWTPTIVPATANTTYTAIFTATKRSYTITWLNEDGSEISHETLEYGATPTHAGMSKENTAEYTYNFIGWTPGIGVVTGDASYRATFDTIKNKYTITWLNDDGSQIDQTTVEYGVVPTHADPTKPATDEHSYTFAGWTPQVVAVTGNATYKATFTETTKTYTITWLNEDGSEISHDNLAYGATPSHANPTKQATAEFTYTFAGWTPEVVAVTGNATYKATFTATKRSYTITWLNDDNSQIDQTTVEYGIVPTHTDPTKETTGQNIYTFAGWTPEVVAVTGNATYKATFTKTNRSYTISWLDNDGTTIDQTTVEYGATPTHANINKESTAQYTYTFAGWSPKIVPVTGNASYKATYTTTVNAYTITFYFDDGTTILEQIVVPYGETPSCQYTPSKVSDAHHYYTFTGWTPEIVPVIGDASYIPTFEKIARQYKITFRNYNGKELQSSKFDYDAMPKYTGETPTKKGTEQYTYVFAGWDPELAPVSGDETYRAVFDAIVNTFTITFYDEDGITKLDQVEVEYGKVPSTPIIPVKENDDEYIYTFAGWQPKPVKATKEASYKATYKATRNTEGINNIEMGETATKVIIDNQIFIRRGGNTYTIDGQLVE